MNYTDQNYLSAQSNIKNWSEIETDKKQKQKNPGPPLKRGKCSKEVKQLFFK